MKKHYLKTLAIGCFSLSMLAHAADPVTLNITGNIIASPCQISSDSVTKAIDLGQNIQASSLQAAGASSAWVPFTINLTSCPAGTTKAIMTMHGAADPARPADLYLSTGTATNVSVQLQMQSGEPMGDGKSYTGNISSNAYSYNMQARAYSVSGGATPGTISSVVTATFVYQ